MAIDVSTIKPSPKARKLYQNMVQRAHNNPRTGVHLSMGQTLELAVVRNRQGLTDEDEIRELQDEGWIKQAADGGWLLD